MQTLLAGLVICTGINMIDGDENMPGYMTHYIFGKQEYKKLPESTIKAAIKSNINVFNMGLQGPDIFFYYPYSVFIGKKNLGSMMHRYSTGKYIDKMMEYVLNSDSRKKQDIAIAYMTGFLGHYWLDVTCHPYIYYKTDYVSGDKLYHGRHIALETDIDYMMVNSYLKKKTSKIHYGKLIKLSSEQSRVVAEMLSHACTGTYSSIRFDINTALLVVRNMSNVINFINDRNGLKKKIINYISKVIIICKNMETLLINEDYELVYSDPLNTKKESWSNPFEKGSKVREDSFIELMEIASDMYQTNVKAMAEGLDSISAGKNQDSDNMSFRENLKNIVGNKSLLTGLTSKAV